MRKLILIIGLLISLRLFAIDHYWSGTGTWDNSTTTCWYTDSTFTTHSAAIPTSSDNVYFCKAAVQGTCSVSAVTPVCLNLDCHGWTGTINNTGYHNVHIYGNIYVTKTISLYSVYLENTSGTATISCNGYGICSAAIARNGIGGTTMFTSSMTVGVSFTVYAGTANFNGQTLYFNNIAIGSTAAPSSIIMGDGADIIVIGGVDFTTNSTNFTFIANKSTIEIQTGYATLAGNGNTFYNVYYDKANINHGTITGSNTFNILKIAPTVSGVFIFTVGTTQTITGDFIVNGTASITVTLESTSTSAVANISSTGTIGCSNSYVINGVSGSYYGISYTGSGSGYLGITSTHPGTSSGWNYTACPWEHH